MYQEGTTGVANPGRAIGDAVDLARLSTKWAGFDDTLEGQIDASERILQGARNYALNPLPTSATYRSKKPSSTSPAIT